jgi:hypothetical protein
LGGVTTEQVDGVCLSFGLRAPVAVKTIPGVGQDASTVLSIKAPTHMYRPAPKNTTVEPLECEIIGSRSSSECYHGGDLLPGNSDQQTMVLTPGLYAPKGQWAMHSLTMEEIIVAKDCDCVAMNLLGSGTITNKFLQTLLPVKCLVALANCWECNRGGSFFSIPKEAAPDIAVSKRQKRDCAPCSDHAGTLIG